MIAPEEAWRRLLEHLRPLPARRLPRALAAGRVVAESLRATVDVPFADVSAMDGYAVGGDAAAGTSLPVVATVAAGAPPGLVLPPGAAARIMTGAPLPVGADRVVPREEVAADGEQIAIRVAPPSGAHVRRRGEVQRAGEPLLAAGDLLTPGALALLAAHGHDEVAVHPPPRLALLVTGDEVVAPERKPGPGQLRDSHGAFVVAAATAAGAEVRSLGIAGDDPRLLRERLEQGLAADLLLVTGGVSQGDYDFVEPVLAALGFDTLFDAVAIQPGKPLVAAVAGAGQPLVFGLPGNPASAMVCFWLFVRPALRRLQGHADGFWVGALDGTLATALPSAGARDRFLPATVEAREGRLHVTPWLARGSHDLAAYARGNALVRVTAGSPPAPAGAHCSVLPL
ncbi:MAG TPA: gephyrin-like molybdotransferase Glp [Thermoanaerobaculia bacterium]|jgi:molybdopterin molybdotransferase|nr:gephyrin-like molybdotransferase Glp [Thermoanaerobaculia bacterium]